MRAAKAAVWVAFPLENKRFVFTSILPGSMYIKFEASLTLLAEWDRLFLGPDYTCSLDVGIDSFYPN
jgi:hypothetical protein